MLRFSTTIYILVSICSFIFLIGCSKEKKANNDIYNPDFRKNLISELRKDRFNPDLNEKLWRIDTRNFEFDSVLY